MKIAALILGIIGGLIGLALAFITISIGGLGTAFGAEGASTVVGLSAGAIAFSVIGVIGGAIALTKPKLAGALMIVAAIGGVISVSLFYAVPGVLLLIAGLLALFARAAPAQA